MNTFNVIGEERLPTLSLSPGACQYSRATPTILWESCVRWGRSTAVDPVSGYFLSLSSVEPNTRDRPTRPDEPDRRHTAGMVRVIHSRLSVSSEVQGRELTFVFYPGFLDNYAQTVTRKKVAGMEVESLLELLFWLLKSTSSSFCKSPARPFFSAASKAFMVGP